MSHGLETGLRPWGKALLSQGFFLGHDGDDDGTRSVLLNLYVAFLVAYTALLSAQCLHGLDVMSGLVTACWAVFRGLILVSEFVVVPASEW